MRGKMMQQEESKHDLKALFRRVFIVPPDVPHSESARLAELEEARRRVRFDSRFNQKHDYSMPRRSYRKRSGSDQDS